MMKGLWVRDYIVDSANPLVTAGTRHVQSWRANSIYDPDATSTSVSDSSVFWLADMTQMYYNYIVYGCKIKICGFVRNLGATNYNPCRVYLVASDQSTPPTDETAILLHPYHKTKIIDPLLSSTASGNNWFSFKMFKKSKDIFSRSLIQDTTNDAGFTGTVGTGTNPVNVWYYHLIIYNGYPTQGGGSANAQNAWFRVKLLYNTKYFDRKDAQGADYYGTNVPA